MEDDDIIMLEEDKPTDKANDWASNLPAERLRKLRSGFYRSNNEAPGGFRPVLLALELSDNFFHEIRPLTGVKA